ncbi:hypothetical protein QQS21_011426 [Conoideocrella luteorostrata]|uniref:DUF7924 domain-containing protein n=1 Tax=Conoideocrella luteorostrata TaxID=1105319 RepID=A0AAJ0CD98_9HYPO|nr:hypothetical protein QQS21_011426 [Conoideocrella luteorostrata]
MAKLRERKRKRSDEPPQGRQTLKRVKPARRRQDNFSPAFWDSLSKIPLTRRALRELDRRNDDNNNNTRLTQRRKDLGEFPTDVYRFARRGGPDLGHLCGCPEPFTVLIKMSSRRSSTSRSRQTQSTKATTVVTNKTKKSSAYGKDFEQLLTDHNIYLPDHDHGDNVSTPEPRDMHETQQLLMVERASLSPSQFPQSAFRDFKTKNSRSAFEQDVMSTVVPVICGTSSNIPNSQNVLFTELAPIVDEDTVKPKPDFFDGARLHELDKALRDDKHMRTTVIPTKHMRVPVAPNFYLEVKGPEGNLAVAQRQACYDGANGARAMHALQNYGADEAVYDGNAHTFSTTYHAGTLEMYAHHMTAPTVQGERPQYHMTQIDGWHMTGNIDTFRRGATAFRNARDLAQRQRETFIRAANTTASQAGLAAATTATTENAGETYQDDELTTENAGETYQDNELTTENAGETCPDNELRGREVYSETPAWQDSHDDLQNHIAETCVEECQGDYEAPVAIAEPPPPAAAASESNVSYWVETYERRGKIYFRNPEGQEVKTKLNDWGEEMMDGIRRFYWQSPKSGRVFWTKERPRLASRRGRRR